MLQRIKKQSLGQWSKNAYVPGHVNMQLKSACGMLSTIHFSRPCHEDRRDYENTA